MMYWILNITNEAMLPDPFETQQNAIDCAKLLQSENPECEFLIFRLEY